MLLTLYDLLVPDSQDPIYVQDKNLCEYQIQLINHTYIYIYIYTFDYKARNSHDYWHQFCIEFSLLEANQRILCSKGKK